jgi:hypothetical protein
MLLLPMSLQLLAALLPSSAEFCSSMAVVRRAAWQQLLHLSAVLCWAPAALPMLP